MTKFQILIYFSLFFFFSFFLIILVQLAAVAIRKGLRINLDASKLLQ